MIKDFGSINVKLGEFQKLVRGNKEIPIYGLHRRFNCNERCRP